MDTPHLSSEEWKAERLDRKEIAYRASIRAFYLLYDRQREYEDNPNKSILYRSAIHEKTFT